MPAIAFLFRSTVSRSNKSGIAYADAKGFLTDLPHRQSFSPDAAFYTGPRAGMSFLPVPPVFAVEVRRVNDYGPKAERAMARKREDYFASGTLVVWDVDLQSEDVIRVYRANSPETPTVYKRGEMAEAEPAVPGWRMPVDELFRDERITPPRPVSRQLPIPSSLSCGGHESR